MVYHDELFISVSCSRFKERGCAFARVSNVDVKKTHSVCHLKAALGASLEVE